MVTAIIAARATAIGGIHLHKLFGLNVKTKGTPYRLTKLALDKLHGKGQILCLHVLLIMDVLLFDKSGQLSEQQLKLLDTILQKISNTNLSFGGVLILGSMYHAQFGAVNGLSFLIVSHILTNFYLRR